MSEQATGFPRGLLGRSGRVRLSYFAAYTMGHALIAMARDAVLRVLTRPTDTWTPITFVIGPTGVGKTTLLRSLERELTRLRRRELLADPGRLPYVSVVSEVPEAGSFNWKDFCLAGLEAMREPLIARKIDLAPPELLPAAALATRTSASALRRALISALAHRAPAALLIDEAQQLAMVTGSRKFQHQMDYLKRLADATGVPTVLVGNYGLCLLRNQSAQLARRTTDVHFRRYDATRAQDAADFQDIVLSFQQHLPLAESPNLVEHWAYLYLRSVGCIGLLKQWLLEALEHAVQAGAATLTRADLERAAPPPSKSKKALEEALDGEAALAELAPDADPRAAETELRTLLRLPQPPSTATTTAQRERRGRRRPGERQPERDPIGPTATGAVGG